MAKATDDPTASTPTVTVGLDRNAWQHGRADGAARLPWRCRPIWRVMRIVGVGGLLEATRA